VRRRQVRTSDRVRGLFGKVRPRTVLAACVDALRAELAVVVAAPHDEQRADADESRPGQRFNSRPVISSSRPGCQGQSVPMRTQVRVSCFCICSPISQHGAGLGAAGTLVLCAILRNPVNRQLHEACLGAKQRRSPNRVMIAVRGARFGGLEKAAVGSSRSGVGWPWAAQDAKSRISSTSSDSRVSLRPVMITVKGSVIPSACTQ
jgi:hypothetical protein